MMSAPPSESSILLYRDDTVSEGECLFVNYDTVFHGRGSVGMRRGDDSLFICGERGDHGKY
jgi:hypothetical protein